MPRLNLRLLGPFQATLDGRPINGFESNKVRALLVYLAIESDRPHSRDELVGLLWPDQPDAAARANLRQALANLRHIIGDRTSESPLLQITTDSIQLKCPDQCWSDVAAFTELITVCRMHLHRQLETCPTCAQRLQKANELYREDFLTQLLPGGSEALEEWILQKREHYHHAASSALYALIEYHDRRGEYAQVQHYARRQLELDPWCEEAHRQLMRALALSGQRSAALAQYEACCRVLAAELNARPDKETTALYEQIHSGRLRAMTSKVTSQTAAGFSETFAALNPPLEQTGQAADIVLLNCGIVLIANLAATRRQLNRAVRLLGISVMLSDTSGVPLPPGIQPVADQIIMAAQHQLDAVAFDSALAEGRAMTFAQAIDYSLNLQSA